MQPSQRAGTLPTTRTPAPRPPRTPTKQRSQAHGSPQPLGGERFVSVLHRWPHPYGEVASARDQNTEQEVWLTILDRSSGTDGPDLGLSNARLDAIARLSNSSLLLPEEVTSITDGRTALVTRACPALPLSRLLMGATLRADRATRILVQVCQVLAALHDARITHGALCLANVLVRTQGAPPDTILLTDLALQPFLSTHRAPRADQALAAPFSPERVLGLACDPREDIYLVGSLAYSLLSGGPPFRTGSASELSRRHAIEEPMPLARRRRDGAAIRPALATWVHRCLAKDPDDRYENMAQALTELREVSRLDQPKTAAGHCPPASLPTPDVATPQYVDATTDDEVTSKRNIQAVIHDDHSDQLTVARAVPQDHRRDPRASDSASFSDQPATGKALPPELPWDLTHVRRDFFASGSAQAVAEHRYLPAQPIQPRNYALAAGAIEDPSEGIDTSTRAIVAEALRIGPVHRRRRWKIGLAAVGSIIALLVGVRALATQSPTPASGARIAAGTVSPRSERVVNARDFDTAPKTTPVSSRSKDAPIPGPWFEPDATAQDLVRGAQVSAAAGRVDDAEILYRRATLRDPKNVEALMSLGRIEFARGDRTRATRYFERAALAAPGNREASQAYRNALQAAKAEYEKP